MQLEVEGLRGGRDAGRHDRVGWQRQDVLHAVPAPRTIRIEEERRLIVADVRRERFEIVDLGAEVAADAAFDVRVDVPGRDGCAGEETDEQGSNRGEGEARAKTSHEVPPLDSETRAILVPPSHTRESGDRFTLRTWNVGVPLSRSADAAPPMSRDDSAARARFRASHFGDRARSAARARHLARGARDRSAERLDRGRGHSRGETGEADRGFGSAVRAEYWTADAHHPLGRLLVVDGVAAPPDRGELALETRERRDRGFRSRRELRRRPI